jgi:hypothetical protein
MTDDADLIRFVKLVREYQQAANKLYGSPDYIETVHFRHLDEELTAAIRQLTQRQEPQLFDSETSTGE